MVVGSEQEYLAVLLTLQTKRDDATGKMTNELTDHAKNGFDSPVTMFKLSMMS